MGKILRVTMQDVAEKVGCTQATVSLALRKHPAISAATRHKVEHAATELGYQQHGAISTMMARVRMQRPIRYQATLGALILWRETKAWEENVTFQRYLTGARQRAGELGFRVDEFWPEAKGISPERLGRILRTRRVEGLIVMPLPPAGRLALDLAEFATATIGYSLRTPPIHRATTAHFEEMMDALLHMTDLGYSRIGAVIDAEVNERIERKWSAAYQVYAPLARRFAPLLLNRQASDSADKFNAWFNDKKPDALIVCNLPAVEWLRVRGISVPKQVGLAMLGERYQQSNVARFDERSERVGAAAVEIVVAQLHRNERGLPKFPQAVHVEGAWVQGSSLRRVTD